MADLLQVEVVSASRVVWSGLSHDIVAKTIEGDIGILPGHEAVLAVLVPGAIQIFAADHTREVIAVDGGYISVAHNNVWILSEFAEMAEEISLTAAERELAEAQAKLDLGDESEETRAHFAWASAQIRAAEKVN